MQYFKITAFEKIENYKADILFQISPTEPVYVNQINISGNDRTFDYVFRRELKLSEGDPVNTSKIKNITRQLNNLKFIGSAKVETTTIDENSQDIDIIVEEIQTGSFNVGLSLGTLDGASFVSGIKENNINGTGRSLEFLVNTNQNNKEFILSTSDKFFINNKVNHGYSINYNENDFSKSQSYKLNTFTLDTSFNYKFSDYTYHTIGFGYSLKEYQVTDASASDNIKNSEGVVSILEPELRIYNQPNIVTSEADIKTNIFTDKFMTMNLVQNQDYFNIRYQMKPFMIWIWISVLIISFGGLISLFKTKYEN